MTHTGASPAGLISAPHRCAAEAGAAVLREGGTAIEAMVAAAATIAVVYPHMTGLGGDGFWLIAEPGCEPVAIRACGAAAARATPAFYRDQGHDTAIPGRGPLAAVTTAGTVAGWAEALKVSATWGGRPLPLSRLLADAIGQARDGVAVSRSQATLTDIHWESLVRQPGFRDTFAPDGPPRAGTVLRYPDLADTLDRLARAGLDDFYRGDLARTLAEGLERVATPLALADLEATRARRVVPLSVDLAAGRVFNHPPPTQGAASLMVLGLFERLGVTEAEGFAHVHGLVEATKRAFLLRDAALGDPDRMTVDPGTWLTPATLKAEAARIHRLRALPWVRSTEPGDTVWMGAIDGAGRVVSYIQSLYWEFGSGVVVPGTGVVWQNRGAAFSLTPGPNELGPGRLPRHTLNPALARLADGRVLAYGTMGGDGQPQTQAAVFTRHVVFGQAPDVALEAPRWLLGRTWGADATSLKVESRLDPVLIETLRAAGHDVEVVEAYDNRMGHAGLVSMAVDGQVTGAADPRADGACVRA